MQNKILDDDFSSLTLNIVDEFRKFQIAFPEKNAKKNLTLVKIPKTVTGDLTLTALIELAKRHFLSDQLDETDSEIISPFLFKKPEIYPSKDAGF